MRGRLVGVETEVVVGVETEVVVGADIFCLSMGSRARPMWREKIPSLMLFSIR